MGHPADLKTKFEADEPEPVFEEELHGDGGVDHFADEPETSGEALSRHDTSSKSSATDDSVDEGARKM